MLIFLNYNEDLPLCSVWQVIFVIPWGHLHHSASCQLFVTSTLCLLHILLRFLALFIFFICSFLTFSFVYIFFFLSIFVSLGSVVFLSLFVLLFVYISSLISSDFLCTFPQYLRAPKIFLQYKFALFSSFISFAKLPSYKMNLSCPLYCLQLKSY